MQKMEITVVKWIPGSKFIFIHPLLYLSVSLLLLYICIFSWLDGFHHSPSELSPSLPPFFPSVIHSLFPSINPPPLSFLSISLSSISLLYLSPVPHSFSLPPFSPTRYSLSFLQYQHQHTVPMLIHFNLVSYPDIRCRQYCDNFKYSLYKYRCN